MIQWPLCHILPLRLRLVRVLTRTLTRILTRTLVVTLTRTLYHCRTPSVFANGQVMTVFAGHMGAVALDGHNILLLVTGAKQNAFIKLHYCFKSNVQLFININVYGFCVMMLCVSVVPS